jgi:pimeloyl-ACP methyl ester carboxylesterase
MAPLLTQPIIRLIDSGEMSPDGVFWVNFTGYQITSEFAATQFMDCNVIGESSMYAPFTGRDRLITLEHNLIGYSPEVRYDAVAHAIARYAGGRKVILVGLSLGGFEAAGVYSWILEHCPGLFESVALVLISTPGHLTDLQPGMQKLVRAVADHPATIGRAASLAARYAPGLFLTGPQRRDLRRYPMLKHCARASIAQSADWLQPAVDRLAAMNGFGPPIEGGGPVVMAHLDQAAEDLIDVARAELSVRATFGDHVPSFRLNAPYHGTPWLHPWHYQHLLAEWVRPRVMSGFHRI